jgi:hypothetical protein
MLPVFPTFLRLLLVLLFMGAGPALADFAPPVEGPVPFRRDRLPLSVESMARLSSTLGQLGGRMETPKERRSLAQRLALALALDPANREAREQLEGGAAGLGRASSNGAEAQALIKWCWEVLVWIESPEAGKDARALAACLRDVLVTIDPEHPAAVVTSERGEGGAWSKWVPDLAAYEGGPKPDAEVDETPADLRKIFLKEAMLRTVLYTTDEAKRTALAVVPVNMEVRELEDENLSPFAFSLSGGTPEKEPLEKTIAEVTKLLSERHPSLPKGVRARLTIGEGSDYLAALNGSMISATAAALMDSALTGVAADAVILGTLQSDGSFVLPTEFWAKLRQLGKSPGGGRLILPLEAAEWLPSILALEDPGFFFKYEVLLAANLDELITRTSMESPASFVELKKRATAAVTVPGFLSDVAVRQRLTEISMAMPPHGSARMLGVQASGERPTRLPRHILAAELRRALEPVAQLSWDLGSAGLDGAALDKAFQSGRADVAALERQVDIRDRDLHVRSRDLALAVRSLGRKGSGSKPAEAVTAWRSFDEMRKSVFAELAREAAHPDAVQQPE